MILLLPVVIFVFIGGVYLGEYLVTSQLEGTRGSSLQPALPGTNSILRPWSNESSRLPINQVGLRLRGIAPSGGNTAENSIIDRARSEQTSDLPNLRGLDAKSGESRQNPTSTLIPERTHITKIRSPKPSVVHSKAKRSIDGILPHSHRADPAPHFKSPDDPMPSAINSKAERSVESILSHSLHADPTSFFKAPESLDNRDIIVGAWIYLDSAEISTMRTVFSNKEPGCGSAASRNGFAMYVNTWETSDKVLGVEFGSLQSGCDRITSRNIKISALQWYHVAVSFIGDAVSLYVDGVQVASEMGKYHETQISNPLYVGIFDEQRDYPLFGNISHLAISHNPKTSVDFISIGQIVQSMMSIDNVLKTPSLSNLYTFSEAALANPGLSGLDSIGKKHGKYTFAPAGKRIAGISTRLSDGTDGVPASAEARASSDDKGRTRRESIREAMKFVWSNYRAYAWGMDELKPISKTGQNNWGGLGVTLVDSLDTLWLMGLKEEFREAVDWVKNRLTFDHTGQVSVFETTIRELGGLLSAYDLSGEPALLDKADDLGSRLSTAFATQSGIPVGQVSLSKTSGGNFGAYGAAVLSELGTLQVEFRYLAHATRKKEYETKAMRPIQLMHRKHPPHGLFPIKIQISDGNFADKYVTFGALGDSFYEYLLKVWIQGGKKETWLREMYDAAINGVIEVLLKTTATGYSYVSDWDGFRNHDKMDHLVCFLPGIMALGSVTDPQGKDSQRAQRDMGVAKALMNTCREMYHKTASSISPEFVTFGRDIETRTSAPFYILRPETAESLFVLNQLTGDPIYRDWAWEIWQAIEKHCRTVAGFGALRDVNVQNSGVDDRMESFFLAETLKYLYLAQDPDHPIDLMKYVFNTEAHPMKILPDSHVNIEA
jgi:hypothetical protein